MSELECLDSQIVALRGDGERGGSKLVSLSEPIIYTQSCVLLAKVKSNTAKSHNKETRAQQNYYRF